MNDSQVLPAAPQTKTIAGENNTCVPKCGVRLFSAVRFRSRGHAPGDRRAKPFLYVDCIWTCNPSRRKHKKVVIRQADFNRPQSANLVMLWLPCGAKDMAASDVNATS